MKSGRFALAGGILVVLAGVLLFRARDSAASSNATPLPHGTGPSPATGGPASGSSLPLESRREREEVTRGAPAVSPGPATALNLEAAWQSGDESAVLDALDQVAELTDPKQWRAVSDVLVQRAATEARSDIIDYLLATGDAAPTDIRLSIYASALENRAPGVSDSARLELLNLTGQKFSNAGEAREWIRRNPGAAGEIPADQ